MPSWSAQIASLHLSEEQTRVLLAMRRLYLQNMGALERRREELAALVMPVRCLGGRSCHHAHTWKRFPMFP